MSRFHVFRYQILPITQQVQLSLDQVILDEKQLKERKNEFFADAVTNIDEFIWSRAKLAHKVLYNEDDLIIMVFGADRGYKRTTHEFEREVVEDWPAALVIIDNTPTVQKIALEVEYKAFRKTSTLASILENNLNQYLHKYLLSVTLLPIFDKHQFWDVVAKYDGQIRLAEFEMVSPNMSNISQSMRFDLRQLHKNTNTQHTKLSLKSDKGSSLTLSADDDFISSIVDYSSEGGGNITLRVRGIRRKISNLPTSGRY